MQERETNTGSIIRAEDMAIRFRSELRGIEYFRFTMLWTLFKDLSRFPWVGSQLTAKIATSVKVIATDTDSRAEPFLKHSFDTCSFIKP